MSENKELIEKKESFFSKILNTIKSWFRKDKNIQEVKLESKIEVESKNENETENKKEFLSNIKVEGNSELISLKIKLENGNIKAIDLTDKQIDQLQEIYDREIEEKREKIKKLKDAA